MMPYLIWSHERRAWLKKNGGNTTATHKAGEFSLEEATQITTDPDRIRTGDLTKVEAPSRAEIERDLADPD
jgi:hypothetical protein